MSSNQASPKEVTEPWNSEVTDDDFVIVPNPTAKPNPSSDATKTETKMQSFFSLPIRYFTKEKADETIKETAITPVDIVMKDEDTAMEDKDTTMKDEDATEDTDDMKYAGPVEANASGWEPDVPVHDSTGMTPYYFQGCECDEEECPMRYLYNTITDQAGRTVYLTTVMEYGVTYVYQRYHPRPGFKDWEDSTYQVEEKEDEEDEEEGGEKDEEEDEDEDEDEDEEGDEEEDAEEDEETDEEEEKKIFDEWICRLEEVGLIEGRGGQT